MKKLIVFFLLLAIVSSFCAFAEDPEATPEAAPETVAEAVPEAAPEPVAEAAPEKAPEKKSLVKSVQIGGGFDLFTANGKFREGSTSKNSSSNGFGFSIAASIDLSAIPHFLKEGWYAYFGMDFFFSKKMTFFGEKYPSDTIELKSSFGYNINLIMLYHTTFDTAFDFFFGGGLSYSSIAGKPENPSFSKTLSASSWGVALYAEGDYTIGKHFAFCVSIVPSFSFLTKLQSKTVDEGFINIEKRTSFGFGFDLAAKAGIKYIF